MSAHANMPVKYDACMHAQSSRSLALAGKSVIILLWKARTIGGSPRVDSLVLNWEDGFVSDPFLENSMAKTYRAPRMQDG